MDNMIPLTQTTVKSRKARGSRSNETKKGWEAYYKIACRMAWRWNSNWFPTTEDLGQAAALAASVAFNELGEEANLKDLSRVLSREIAQQTRAYGQRWETFKKPDGSKGERRINREVTYTHLTRNRDHDESNSNTTQYLESRMMVLGVGEYTRYHAHFLHDLLH